MNTSVNSYHSDFTYRSHIYMLAIVLLLSACSSLFNDNEENATLDSSLNKWGQENYSHYAFIVDRSCFCPGGFYPAMVVVEADTVSTALDPNTNKPIPIDSLTGGADKSYSNFYPTIDDLFELIEDARQQDADILEVTYNDEFGYPEKIVIDYSTAMADEEISYTISGYSPIGVYFSSKRP